MKMRMLLLMLMAVTGAQLKASPGRVKRQSYGGMTGGGYGNNYGGGNSYGGARAYGGGPSLGRANVDVSFTVFWNFVSCLSLDKCPFSISSTIEHVNGKDGLVFNI